MDGYLKLAKAAGWVLLVVFVVCVIGFVIHSIHESGFDAGVNKERSFWQEKNAKQEKERSRNEEVKARELRLAMEREAKDWLDHEKNLLGVIDEKTRKNKELDTQLASVRNAYRGLWIDSQGKVCGGISETGKADDTSVPGGGTGQTRLPERAERFLQTLAADADRVVIQYDACRKELRNVTTVAEETIRHAIQDSKENIKTLAEK